METVRGWTDRDLRRLDEIIVEGERRFKERQPRSEALIAEARGVLAGGATSSWQIARPQMIWVSHGEGSRIYDADGGEYVDLHGGYGVGAVGHGHPRIVEALTRRVPRGTHFAQPTEDAIAVADELARRFGLPLWRFSNSGTEAMMDAVHLMRAITVVHDHGAVLTFDEVKCGVTTAYGGASGYLGVSPDMVCLARAIGGGVPCGAIGGTEEVMGRIADGTYDQVGIFNGNPLTMAASRATLTEILTLEAYEHFDRLGKIMSDGVRDVVEEYDLAAYPLAFGAKGSVTFSGRRVRNYRDFLELDDRFSQVHWLFQHNGGAFLPPWGKAEQWTLSVQHYEDDAWRFVDNFGAFARALRA